MSAFEHSRWKGGFPFSPSRIRAGRRLQAGDVTAPRIAEPVEPPPQGGTAAAAVGPGALPPGLRPMQRPAAPVGRQHGLRLLPLQAFVWGSRAMPPQPRTRPDHTLIWVTQGLVQLDFPREHPVLRAGELRHIPAGTAFAAVPAAGAAGHVALISAQLAAGADPALPEHGMAAHVGSHAAQLEATLHELAVETPRPDLRALACLMNLLSLRLRQLLPDPPAPAGEPAPPDLPLIQQFLALAETRLDGPDSVAELAAELGSSTSALDQACLAARGKRAVELIHQLRLDRAVELLRGTDRPTLRIATDLGYASHAHFIRAFVAATGRTPEAFRDQSC